MNNNKGKEIYEQSFFGKHKETGQVVKVGRVSNSSVEGHEEDGRPNGTTYDLFLSEFIPLNQNSMEVILFEKNFQKLLKKFEEKEKELEIANSILKNAEFIIEPLGDGCSETHKVLTLRRVDTPKEQEDYIKEVVINGK